MQLTQASLDMENTTQSDPSAYFKVLNTTVSLATMAQKQICTGHLFYSYGTQHCSRKGCKFSVTNSVQDQCSYSFTTKDGAEIGLDYAPIWASHTVGNSHRVRCRVCWTEELFDWLGLFAHLKEIYTASELRGAFGGAVNACYYPDTHSRRENSPTRRHAETQHEWERSQSVCVVC